MIPTNKYILIYVCAVYTVRTVKLCRTVWDFF